MLSIANLKFDAHLLARSCALSAVICSFFKGWGGDEESNPNEARSCEDAPMLHAETERESC